MKGLLFRLKVMGMQLMKLLSLTVIFGFLFSSFNTSGSMAITFAASLTPEADSYHVNGVHNQSQPHQNLDLEIGANRSEAASEEIYQGLEKTKDFIGKTEPRKQVIEKAREKASNQLKEQSERAKTAESPDSLDPNERNFLKNIQ